MVWDKMLIEFYFTHKVSDRTKILDKQELAQEWRLIWIKNI